MPGFYKGGEYDIAGFAVGVVDREKIITGEKIKAGDSIIGISSSGLHSNGYSLARKVFFERMGLGAGSYMDEFGETLGKVLLTPTKIYAPACRTIFPLYDINGIAHITGGGFFENIPRVLPKGLCAKISTESWEQPRIFRFIQECGNVDEMEMFGTFNMGIGMVMFMDNEIAADVLEDLESIGEKAYLIGEVAPGEGVHLE
jgi:phosphoribosylformylglycinamidine cyclo-ligase